ncbi:hypothetical protein HDF18_20280 [Mucilaginibacter sp. X5P1]|uniref:hypothetical protein n=1 Tax=Mucilaginibacter sp. X5P1 TaxID=2723088 RepID=UPI00160E3DD6|nr:hypothetical protein [Mucilaginibacter sp. X5P1]MBB6141965.1 hypothetical protein [Mucilaginibacter sp. X5P1]
MKKLSILLTAIIALSFFSCNKDQNSANTVVPTAKKNPLKSTALGANPNAVYVSLTYQGNGVYNVSAQLSSFEDGWYHFEVFGPDGFSPGGETFITVNNTNTFWDNNNAHASSISLTPTGNYFVQAQVYDSSSSVEQLINNNFTVYPQPIFTGTTTTFPSNYASTTFEATIVPAQGNGTQIFRSLTPALTVGQSLYSPNGLTELKLQPDGNLVLYVHNSDGSKTGIWASNTVGKASASLTFQPDGNLVIKDAAGNGLWASNINSADVAFKTQTNNAPYYNLQNDGNFVLYWPEHYAITNAAGTSAGENACYVIAAAADATAGSASIHSGSLVHNYNYGGSGTNYLPPNSFKLQGSGFLSN